MAGRTQPQFPIHRGIAPMTVAPVQQAVRSVAMAAAVVAACSKGSGPALAPAAAVEWSDFSSQGHETNFLNVRNSVEIRISLRLVKISAPWLVRTVIGKSPFLCCLQCGCPEVALTLFPLLKLRKTLKTDNVLFCDQPRTHPARFHACFNRPGKNR